MKWAVKPVKKPSGALKELLPCLNKNFSPQTSLLRQAKNGDLATSKPFLHIIHSLKNIFSTWWCITDLGSLIGNLQCWNFRIFLPLRFYAKSILVILRPQKLPFWLTIWVALNFTFYGNILHFHAWNFSKNQNWKHPRLLKVQFLTFWNQPKLISRKIREAQKLLNFYALWNIYRQYSQLGCPGL